MSKVNYNISAYGIGGRTYNINFTPLDTGRYTVAVFIPNVSYNIAFETIDVTKYQREEINLNIPILNVTEVKIKITSVTTQDYDEKIYTHSGFGSGVLSKTSDELTVTQQQFQDMITVAGSLLSLYLGIKDFSKNQKLSKTISTITLVVTVKDVLNDIAEVTFNNLNNIFYGYGWKQKTRVTVNTSNKTVLIEELIQAKNSTTWITSSTTENYPTF